MAKLSFLKDKGFWAELIRFLIVGVYGTLIDYVVEVWCTSIFSSWIAGAGIIVAFFVQFFISIIGFVVSTPATWSLSSVWAFRNYQNEAENKSLKGALKFTFWAFLGLLGASIIQFLGYMTFLQWSGLNINILAIDFSSLFSSDINIFVAYTIVFVLKTGFNTVFNYLTRKFILYKKQG